ncbi:hypothetical protein GQ53DRAFT_521554 [Thozetella sp. PMI_491]|nr:hypothetical protein GQ53DRAFT_521554 [Thozetella sp. PMI_491]
MTFGLDELANAVSCPRHYFLRILEARLGRVRVEWKRVVKVIKAILEGERLHDMVALKNSLLKTTNGIISLEEAREKGSQLLELEKWKTEITHLISKLTYTLERSIASWERFNNTDAGYLFQENSPTNVSSEAIYSLLNVERLYDDLETCLNELRYQNDVFSKDYEAIFDGYRQACSSGRLFAASKPQPTSWLSSHSSPSRSQLSHGNCYEAGNSAYI